MGFIILMVTGHVYHWLHDLQLYQRGTEVSGGRFIMESKNKEGGSKWKKVQIK